MENIILLLVISQITWQNTGNLESATRVYAITKGINGYIFAGTKAGLSPGTLDSGWVFVSKDLWNWEVCDSLKGVQEGVYCLINGAGDTLFAGTGMWGDYPMVYKSGDGGQSWDTLHNYGDYRPGSRVTAFFEDNLGILHLGNDYGGMSAAITRHSHDRGMTWVVDTFGVIYYNSEHYNFFQCTNGTIYFGSWGRAGAIHRSSDYADHWYFTDTLHEGGKDSYCFIETGADTILVSCGYDTARIYRTTDNGNNWTRMGAGYLNEDSARGARALFMDSRGYIYAGTYPNAEVFVSYDKGVTWNSTGKLASATHVYEFIEVVKTVQTQRIDSHFVYAATGPNGDVFRSNWNTIAVDEQASTKLPVAIGMAVPNPFIVATRISGHEDDIFKVYDLTGAMVAEQRGDRVGIDLAPGVYFIREKAGTGGMARIVKIR